MEDSRALVFGRFELQGHQRRLLRDGTPVNLGARALDVLTALAQRRDRVVSKNELLDLVWPGLVVEENNLQVQVSTLRRLLGRQAISTIPGRGYRFTVSECAPLGGETQDAAAIPVSDTSAVSLTNLPPELPPLYGRAEDLSSLRQLIESHKLVTVVGAGGIGKTTLAQALAYQLRGSKENGVWLVELAPVADALQVAPTVAGVLQVTLGAEGHIEALAKALRTSRALILLDNCEHLKLAVAELASALQRSAPNVHMLATSQEPLKVSQECVYRLGALALPSDGTLESARHSGAVALFEARAQSALSRFALDKHNIATVVDICRQLDGIALAIELAAARVPLLGVDGIRERLDERFRILKGGARLALPRHQTLHAALEWSHDLLTTNEQIVFRRLGAFVGSFGLESAQRVAADDSIDDWSVLDTLGDLVDKSLVVAEAGEEPRYRLLETSRTFALEKLREAGETETVLRSHATSILAVYETSCAEDLVLSTQARLKRYLPDLDNARAALDWSSSGCGDKQLRIALTGAMAWIWVVAGYRPEGLVRTKLAIANVEPTTAPHLEARLLGSWSGIAHPETSEHELAADARAVELYRLLGDRRALFAALCQQTRTLAQAHRQEEAKTSLQEAEKTFENGWPPTLLARLLMARAWYLRRGTRFEDAMLVDEELLQLATSLDDKRLALQALIGLEQSAAALGRLEESLARNRDLVQRIQHERFLRSGIENVVLTNLCMTLTRLGQIDEALDVARQAHPLVERSGRVLDLLDPYALLAFKRGRFKDAARMLGRADSRYATGAYQREEVEVIIRPELMLGLRNALPAEELARFMKEGAALSDEDCARLTLY